MDSQAILDQIELYLSSPKVQMKLSEKSINSIIVKFNGNIDLIKALIDEMVYTRNLGM